jgi:hypothetical protein
VRIVRSDSPWRESTSEERFGFVASSSQEPRSSFRWSTPEGWKELPPTSLRQINLQPAGHGDAECYLTVLPGGAGGVAANVDRWRGQLGEPPLGAEGLASLPTADLLGEQAVLVDLEGSYRDMQGTEHAGFRLVGLILEQKAGLVFLKLTGPAELVASEMEAFHALASSIRRMDPPAEPLAARGLSWEVPPGWQVGPQRSMRLFTLLPGGAGSTECYATLLPGDGGGSLGNFDRWRGQMGLAPLSRSEYEGLGVRSVLGVEGRLIDLRGDFTGMSGERIASARMLGLICELGDRALFLKMVGPEHEVEAERASFLELCDSLRFEAGP